MAQPQVMGSTDCTNDAEEASELSEIVAEDAPGAQVRSTSSGGRQPHANGGGTARPTGAQSAETQQRARESLSEQGIHGVQADAALVRMHEEEFLMANFRRWIQCFSLIVCLLTPAMLGIMIWMMVQYARYRGNDCDVPLQMWCMVVLSIVIFNATLNRPSRHGSLIVRLFCLWESDPQAPRRPPCRVRLYNASVALFIFGWNLFGLYLIVFSGHMDSPSPPCEEAAPGLFESVKVYVAVNLTFTIFFYLNMVGFSRVLGIMIRRGMLHSSRAAPKGTLDSVTEKVTLEDDVLKDQASCSVCLDDYDAASNVVRIKVCGHVFHRQCLQGWLSVNRNCPICRRDLVQPPDLPA